MRNFILPVLIFILLTNLSVKTYACAGAGMTQYFPLASNQENQIWMLSIRTIRHEIGSMLDCDAYLILTNSELKTVDSILVFKKVVDKSSGVYDMDKAFDVQPLDLVDSVYHLGVNLLKSKHADLKWFQLLGYSVDGEHEVSPLKLLRAQTVTKQTASRRIHGKDSTYVYYDTSYFLKQIKIYGQQFNDFNIISFEKDTSIIEPLIEPRTAVISSSRLYLAPNNQYIVIFHMNVMGFHGQNEEVVWNECLQETSSMCKAAKSQPFSWHHSGYDYLVFLQKK